MSEIQIIIAGNGVPWSGCERPALPAPRSGRSEHRVLLHDDDVHTCQEVVEVLVAVVQMDIETAIWKMIEADKTGVSTLLVTDREEAHLFRDQLTALGYRVTVEPLHASS